MAITCQPMGTFSGLNFSLPRLANLDSINLDEELLQIRNMVKAGILPSGQRLKEFLAACWQKGELKERKADTIACLVDICRLQEDAVVETPAELKEALVIAETI